MSRPRPSLASRHADLTERVILDAAVALLERAPVSKLTVRALAARGGISERTVFRYFPAREALLDAVLGEVMRRFDLPPDPTSVEDVLAHPEVLYARFDAAAALTKAALHSELSHRIRSTHAQRRWDAVRALIDRAASSRPVHERTLAAANICYYLSATTWHYYRFSFGFSLEQSIQCARMAIAHTLAGLGVRLPAHRTAAGRRRRRGHSPASRWQGT
jgi:AcrR family transcriptional regulator